MEIQPSPFTNQPSSKTPDLFEQYRWHILAGLTIIFIVGIYLALVPPKTTLGMGADVMIAGGGNTPIDQPTTTPPSGQIVVDVAGAVTKPGVYRVAVGSIVEDAINSAGGFSKSADLDAVARQINRAEELKDHSKVYVPKKGDSAIVAVSPSTSIVATGPIAGSQDTININTADNAELELLPTIGPVMAQRIIDYRLQNGSFKSIEDIKNVNGISDAKFAQLQDLITI